MVYNLRQGSGQLFAPDPRFFDQCNDEESQIVIFRFVKQGNQPIGDLPTLFCCFVQMGSQCPSTGGGNDAEVVNNREEVFL